MKNSLILFLVFLAGSMGGFFVAKTAPKTSPPPSSSPRSSRQITPRGFRSDPSFDHEKDTSSQAFVLSDGRDTYHGLDKAKLVAQISQLTENDFPVALDRSNDDDRIDVLLYQRWSKLNPRRALTFLLKETDYNSLDCLEGDLPDVALLTGTALLEREGRNALPLIHDLMKRANEGSIGYNYGDFAGYQSLFKAWATTDFDSTLQFLMVEREGYWYDGSEIGLAEGAAEAGRSKDLMKWIADHPDTFLAYDLVTRTMAAWAEKDPKAALQWAQSDQAPTDERALEGDAQTWIE